MGKQVSHGTARSRIEPNLKKSKKQRWNWARWRKARYFFCLYECVPIRSLMCMFDVRHENVAFLVAVETALIINNTLRMGKLKKLFEVCAEISIFLLDLTYDEKLIVREKGKMKNRKKVVWGKEFTSFRKDRSLEEIK